MNHGEEELPAKPAPLVLIVDDEPDACWALEHILGRWGAQCARARDGGSALCLVKAKRFSVALLDAKLPDMEGLDLAREIRKLARALPMLLVSAYFDPGDPAIQAAIDEGLICEFLGKPFLHRRILEAVAAALSSSPPP